MLYLRISIFILHFFSERHHDAMPFIYFCVKKAKKRLRTKVLSLNCVRVELSSRAVASQVLSP